MFGTKVYTISEHGKGENSILYQMYASLIIKSLLVQKITTFRNPENFTKFSIGLYVIATQSSNKFSRARITNEENNIEIGVPSEFKNLQSTLYLVRHLGYGIHGTVHFAVVQNINVYYSCVVKRFKDKAVADNELKYWNLVYGDKKWHNSSIYKYGDYYCLFLPYFTKLKEEDKQNENVKTKLKILLEEKFWNQHISHNDVRWANIAWYKDELVLFDLAMCETHKSMEEAKDNEFIIELISK